MSKFKADVKTEWNGPVVIKDFDKAMFRSLHESADIVLSQAKALSPSDMAELRGSLNKQVTAKNAVVGTNAEYAPYVEFGTRPHAAPISALQGWADRHGIPVGAVWQSIKRKGTKAQPYLLPSLTANIRKIIAVFKKNNIKVKWVFK